VEKEVRIVLKNRKANCEYKVILDSGNENVYKMKIGAMIGKRIYK
jgi:hypothetical protein